MVKIWSTSAIQKGTDHFPGSSDSGPVHLVQEAKAVDLFVNRSSGIFIILYFYMFYLFIYFKFCKVPVGPFLQPI